MLFDEDKEAQQQQEEQQQLMMGSRPGGQPQRAGATTAPAPTQASVGTPTPFVNFDRYFSANKDAAQGMAGGLASRVESAGTAAESGLARAQDDFTRDVAAGSLAPARNVVVQGEAPIAVGTRDNPTTVVSADEAEKKGRTTYTGPKSLADTAGWSTVSANAEKASKDAGALKTSAGVQALQGAEYAPRTAGQSRFDAGLTRAAGGERFAKLGQRFGGLGKKTGEALGASAVQGAAAANSTKQAAGGYLQAWEAWRNRPQPAAPPQAQQWQSPQGTDSLEPAPTGLRKVLTAEKDWDKQFLRGLDRGSKFGPYGAAVSVPVAMNTKILQDMGISPEMSYIIAANPVLAAFIPVAGGIDKIFDLMRGADKEGFRDDAHRAAFMAGVERERRAWAAMSPEAKAARREQVEQKINPTGRERA